MNFLLKVFYSFTVIAGFSSCSTAVHTQCRYVHRNCGEVIRRDSEAIFDLSIYLPNEGDLAELEEVFITIGENKYPLACYEHSVNGGESLNIKRYQCTFPEEKFKEGEEYFFSFRLGTESIVSETFVLFYEPASSTAFDYNSLEFTN